MFRCLLSEHRRLVAGGVTKDADELSIDEYGDGSTHRDPAASQYRFHVDHFAAIAGTRAVRKGSILANVPLSGPINATADVHMYTSGNLLHVRVCFEGAGALSRRCGWCHGCSLDRGCREWQDRRSCCVLEFLDCGIVLSTWCALDAGNGPVPESWAIQTGTGRRVRNTNGQRKQHRRHRIQGLHQGRRAFRTSYPLNRPSNPLARVPVSLSPECQEPSNPAQPTRIQPPRTPDGDTGIPYAPTVPGGLTFW